MEMNLNMYHHLLQTMQVDHNALQYPLLTMEVALYKLDISPFQYLFLTMKYLLSMEVAIKLVTFHPSTGPLCLYSLSTPSTLSHHYQNSSLHHQDISMEQI